MRDPSRLAAAVATTHLWALQRARVIAHSALSGHDRTLPSLAERRILELPGDEGPLEGRLYRPEGVQPDAPILLFFHGGGFVLSDLDTHEALCIRLACAGRIRVLAASYRLAPEHRFPAQLEDAISVTRWLLSGGAAATSSAGGLMIGGDSAGAYLAASTAARLVAEQPASIKMQLLLYPYLHLDDDVWGASLMHETRALGWAATRYIRAQILDAGQSAPSLLIPSAVAALPTVIATGGVLDPVKDDATALAEQLRKAGATVIWRDYPGLIHGFGNLTHISPKSREAVAEVGSLLGEFSRTMMMR